jgi:hypothetical protein
LLASIASRAICALSSRILMLFFSIWALFRAYCRAAYWAFFRRASSRAFFRFACFPGRNVIFLGHRSAKCKSKGHNDT